MSTMREWSVRERSIPIAFSGGGGGAHQQNGDGRVAQRKTSMVAIGERLVSMLDEIERRVENLRETAALMEQEKDSLMEMLGTINSNKNALRLGQNEKEDIEATTNRLIARCKTVDVAITTPRSPDQERSLQAVNCQMDELVRRMQDNDASFCQNTCHRYLNACAVEQPDGPIDTKFQSQIIGCTAEDQKRIRKRLEQIAGLLATRTGHSMTGQCPT